MQQNNETKGRQAVGVSVVGCSSAVDPLREPPRPAVRRRISTSANAVQLGHRQPCVHRLSPRSDRGPVRHLPAGKLFFRFSMYQYHFTLVWICG